MFACRRRQDAEKAAAFPFHKLPTRNRVE